MIDLKYPLTILISTLLITACGGGGGSNTTAATSKSPSSSSATSTSISQSSSSVVASSLSSSSVSTQILTAEPISDHVVSFDTSDSGVTKAIELWGLDTAWPSADNMTRGVAFMGSERVDVVRVSFTPTAALVDGKLPAKEAALLSERLGYAELARPNIDVVFNSDPPSVASWFRNADNTVNAARWAQLIDVTKQTAESRGHKLVATAIFNEPDCFCNTQGSKQDFLNIAKEIRKNPSFDSVRLTGGNTLDNDQALPWYSALKDYLEEGNTHQLAGTFDNYAGFFQHVVANGDRAVNDELHNVMEAMVGIEYGVKTGIWWGSAELARGEFVKASDGKRLAYAEDRPRWTAASVYRSPEGKIQAFGGASERQALTTTYRFVSKDRDVFYNGVGPTREYTMIMPGGTGYQKDQPNAESVVNVTWGDDVQPFINGRYVLVNKLSKKVMEVAGASTQDGAAFQQGSYSGTENQLWDITPLPARNGGDYSYVKIVPVHSGKSADVNNWSLQVNGNIHQWSYANGANQHWFLKYASNGWFSICSRFSSLCMEVADASTISGAKILQGKDVAADAQLWRLIPVGANVEFDAPAAPTSVQAVGQIESIRVNWNANAEADLAGYTVLRAETTLGPYEIIARDITATNFVDHSINSKTTYYYKVRAGDKSLNQSEASVLVSAASTGEHGLITRLKFDSDTRDSTPNQNNAAISGSLTYGLAKEGAGSLELNGKGQFVQLPATILNHDALTITTWVYWSGATSSQRILDFSSDNSHSITLTPKAESGTARLIIKAGMSEQTLDAASLPIGKWSHIAIVFDGAGAKLYVDNVLADQEGATPQPFDIKPVINLIGSGSNTGTSLNGRIDDFRVYNYALEPAEIQQLFNGN